MKEESFKYRRKSAASPMKMAGSGENNESYRNIGANAAQI